MEQPIGVVYLCRDGEGLVPVRRFVESYRANPAGRPHDLYVLFKGFTDHCTLAAARAVFGDLPMQSIELLDTGFDIGSYALAARQVRNDKLVFLNTFSRILVPGWLAMLDVALEEPGVGVAGASGSWLSSRTLQYPSIPQLSLRRLARFVGTVIHYPGFPNPHLRTNAFMIRRQTMLGLQHRAFRNKEDVLRFESGRWSFTRQVARLAGFAVVVDRSGKSHKFDHWKESRTFWTADQKGLLIADNQTDDYLFGSDYRRRNLERFAWYDPCHSKIGPTAPIERGRLKEPVLTIYRGAVSNGPTSFTLTAPLAEISIGAGSLPRYVVFTCCVSASTPWPVGVHLRIISSGQPRYVSLGPVARLRRARLVVRLGGGCLGLSFILNGDVGTSVKLANLMLEPWSLLAQCRMIIDEAPDLWADVVKQMRYAALRLSPHTLKRTERAIRMARRNFIGRINLGPAVDYRSWLSAVDPPVPVSANADAKVTVLAVADNPVPDANWWRRLPVGAVVLAAESVKLPVDVNGLRVIRYRRSAGLAAVREVLANLAPYVAVLPSYECLHPAFASVVDAFVTARGPFDAIYSDDDELASEGARTNPLFKPDWSPTLQSTRPYVTGTVIYLRDRLLEMSDAGLARLLDETAAGLLPVAARWQVGHIPMVLTHRIGPAKAPRTLSAPTPTSISAPVPRVKISIVIPTAGRRVRLHGRTVDLAVNVVENVRARSNWADDVEVLLVPSRGLAADTRTALIRNNAIVLPAVGGLNLSDKMNQGAAAATGDLIVFMNDDVEVIASDWLERMVAQALRPEVGVVGALLLYENGTVQHGGVVFREFDVRHLYAESPATGAGYLGWLAHPHERAAVTGACIMLRRDVFRRLGGFNDRYAFLYNDIDLCLRARKAGLSVVMEPRARLYHFERRSLSVESTDARDADLFFAQWGNAIAADPYYPEVCVDTDPGQALRRLSSGPREDIE